MTTEIWDNFFTGSKTNYEAKKAAELKWNLYQENVKIVVIRALETMIPEQKRLKL